jgi:hypothetical protein
MATAFLFPSADYTLQSSIIFQVSSNNNLKEIGIK